MLQEVILSCCKDIDAIAFYLLAEERAQVFVILYQVDLAPQKLLQVLCSQNVIEELGGHNYKQVNIAIFAMIATSHRAKQSHAYNAELLLQLRLMLA